VSEADLRTPEFAKPPFDLSDIDAILRREDLLPSGIECRELEPSTYALRIPGETDSARIPTSPDIFDQHFESHQFLFPDSPLFTEMVKACTAEMSEEDLAKIKCLKDLL
jgi:hypothetical protein